MVKKMTYMAPVVRKRISVELETAILTGSVVNKDSNIQTAGQKVETFDFSDASTFNTSWE